MTESTTFDAGFDSLIPAREERAALRAEHEHADKLGVVIGGILTERRVGLNQ